MKLFAPRADWNYRSDQTWWGYVGGAPTAAGVRVNENTAMTFSAVFAATRVIAEGLSTLPLLMKRNLGGRRTEEATDHPVYRLLKNQPNTEQDCMAFKDQQTAFQVNWGNAYAEKQRDSLGKIVNLWPIHPSRIPLRNITRNGSDPSTWREIVTGQPGEIVYWVDNDDNTKTPIPASDMLHIPGVLSQNGVTGQSVIKWGANSIGIGLATERHAGAFFRNGAISNIAIKSAKVVDKDVADRLRLQWQQTFAGADNAYKTLLLEDGMDVVPINLSPEATQLILARQFGVTEIARWYRVPPHMIGDLTRATFSNIESQSLDFVIYCLMPWLVRWEAALWRQLLTEDEKKSYYFTFDVTAMLRGDSAARSAYFQAKFNAGAASPNDWRAADGENPVEGGDTYFVQSNNFTPLNKVEEMADAQIAKLEADAKPPPAPVVAPAPPAEKPKEKPPAEAVTKADIEALLSKRQAEDAEWIAVREVEARKTAAAARDCLLLSLTATLDGWMGYESRAAKQAARKPETFLTWREEFYAEFRGKLEGSLRPFAEAAEPIGFTFDASAAAYEYIRASAISLEPLGDLACDKLAEAVNSVSESWAERPKKFAAELLKGTTCAT